MKILQVCKKLPYPLRDGESIAVTYLSKALAASGAEVTLITMNTSKHFHDVSRDLPSQFAHYKAVHTVGVYNHVHIWGAFKNLFTKDSYHASRFRSIAFEEKLVSLLQSEDFDIVQLETIIPALFIDLIRKHSRAKIAIRPHNVEHEIWDRLADTMHKLNPLRWYIRLSARKLEHFELEHLPKGDMLVPITRRDASSFKQMKYSGAIHVAPIGLDGRDYPLKYLKARPFNTLSFIGSLDWAPNQHGLRWFMQDIWPAVQRHYPHLMLHVAGRNSPGWLKRFLQSHVVLQGEVENAHQFILQHPIMIVPLQSGSGMRVKILEAMFLGRVVITTTVGLEGIHAEHGKQVLVADTSEAFLRCLQMLSSNPNLLSSMSVEARIFAETHYDNIKVGASLLRSYEHLLLYPVQQSNN